MAPKSRKERRRKRESKHQTSASDGPKAPDGTLKQLNKKAKASSSHSPSDKRKKTKRDGKKQTIGPPPSAAVARLNDPYNRFDAVTAAALRKDDEEIAALEAKMGLNKSSKEKTRLHKEWAKLECYGDDFGSFLDDVDTMVQRVVAGDPEDEDYDSYKAKYGLTPGEEKDDISSEDGFQYPDSFNDDDSDDMDDHEDETVPMKQFSLDNNDDQEPFQEDDEGEPNNIHEHKKQDIPKSHDDDDISQSPNDDDEDDEKESDHDVKDTYRPSAGEDIYGNAINKQGSPAPPKKYVPPHLRKQHQQTQAGEEEAEKAKQADEEKQKEIRRLLNNSLNRLSENTMISVAQAVVALYQSYPRATVNECIWKNLQIACIQRPHVMVGLIPVYVACLSGAHVLMGDGAQLGEYLLEKVVTDLWEELSKENQSAHGENDMIKKDASNLMLVLCYLYNYGIVHCSFVYSLIRGFIESFRELEVELLLFILSHCGRSLRSDDPTALKEIVLLVQRRALELQKHNKTATLSSRVEFFISAITDLKNNKKRKADTVHAEKVSKLRKLLGQIKSSAASSRSSDAPSLRIGLDDILNVSTKGRWWKVGASWVGNQFRFSEGGDFGSENNRGISKSEQRRQSDLEDTKEDAKLLKLAAKARMNTDTKRSIFCIIMKSADCEDAFEKLSRAGHMKNRKERDAVRVLMECCGNEKSYNPFYAHLAARMCDYQPQCKFSMQLAYWDVFKQFDDSVSTRRAANLAKLLFHLVAVHPTLKLGVLKALDLSSPEELSESAMIFLTVFFSNLLEHFSNPSDLKSFLESEVKRNPRGKRRNNSIDDDESDMIGGVGDSNVIVDDEGDSGLGPSISIFLLQTLKASPKYKKGSKFRTMLKVAVKACDTEDFFF